MKNVKIKIIKFVDEEMTVTARAPRGKNGCLMDEPNALPRSLVVALGRIGKKSNGIVLTDKEMKRIYDILLGQADDLTDKFDVGLFNKIHDYLKTEKKASR